jgi:starvation-inducible DNA-binding protein
MLRRPRRLCPKSRYEKQIDSASRLVVKHRAHAWLSRCVSASIRTASTRDASVHSSRATGRPTPHRRMSMTSRASADHVPSLRADAREEVGKLLQATLVELLDLALVGKQLHWSVTGPHFRPLHEQLEELVDSWHELADTVAYREVTIGYWPDGQARAIAADSKLAPIERGGVEELMVVAELAHRVAKAGNNARERMDELIDLDPVSQDVLIDVVRKLEEQLWMIRTQLPHGART